MSLLMEKSQIGIGLLPSLATAFSQCSDNVAGYLFQHSYYGKLLIFPGNLSWDRQLQIFWLGLRESG